MRCVGGAVLVVDAIGVDFGQDGDAVADAADNLGGRNPGIQPQRDGGVPQVRRLAGNYPDVAKALEKALGIYRDLSNRQGQANVHRDLGFIRLLTGDYPGGQGSGGNTEHLPRPRPPAESGQGPYRSGAMRRLAQDYSGAARAPEEALGIYRDLGDQRGKAEALSEPGTLHRVRGDQAPAGPEPGPPDRQRLGGSLRAGRPGRCALAADNTASAITSLRQAQEIFRRTS